MSDFEYMNYQSIKYIYIKQFFIGDNITPKERNKLKISLNNYYNLTENKL